MFGRIDILDGKEFAVHLQSPASIPRFAILRYLTVCIAVTYSLTRVALSAGTLLPVLLHTQTNVIWGRAYAYAQCTCIEEAGIIY